MTCTAAEKRPISSAAVRPATRLVDADIGRAGCGRHVGDHVTSLIPGLDQLAQDVARARMVDGDDADAIGLEAKDSPPRPAARRARCRQGMDAARATSGRRWA